MAETLTSADLAVEGGALTAADLAKPAGPDQSSYVAGLLRAAIGQGALMGWGDEAVAKLRSLLGEDYDSALADERKKVAAFRKENPKMALASEIGGGFLTPGLGLAAGALKPAASVLGRVAQGATLGSGIGAVAGAGSADQNRLEGAKQGATFGAAVGGAIPVVGSALGGAVSKAAEFVPGMRLPFAAPAEKAADSIMTRELRAAGETPGQLKQRFADADRARTFHGGVGATNASEADSPLMLADVSPALRSLAGSAVRGSPETGARAEAVIGARQTGIEPPNAKAKEFVDEAGLTTRNPLGVKPANVEKENPAGQHERLRGGLQRAYTLADEDFHGISENAYRTEQDLLSALKERSKKLFPEAYKQAQPFDLSKPFQELTAAMEDRAGGHLATLRRAGNLFMDEKTGQPLGRADQLKRAQSAKEQLDDMISTIIDKKPKLAADLIEFRKNITSALRSSNTKYGEALDFYSGEKRRQEAIEWGRSALRANSNASADEFAAFPKDLQKLARLGILEGIENAGADKTRAMDFTKAFETNRVQNLLRETIPRTATPVRGQPVKGSAYGKRPEMFGEFVGNEKEMIKTRDKLLGNSATAGRLADDERLTRQTLSQMFDRFKQGNIGVVPLALEAVSAGLTKVFGFREDVARELGRRMLTAKRDEIDKVIVRLEARWGSDKVGAFTRFLDQASTSGAIALPGQGGRAIGESKR